MTIRQLLNINKYFTGDEMPNIIGIVGRIISIENDESTDYPFIRITDGSGVARLMDSKKLTTNINLHSYVRLYINFTQKQSVYTTSSWKNLPNILSCQIIENDYNLITKHLVESIFSSLDISGAINHSEEIKKFQINNPHPNQQNNQSFNTQNRNYKNQTNQVSNQYISYGGMTNYDDPTLY